MFDNPQLILENAIAQEGQLAWRSPSNLALIKYWGKHGQQLPRNPSISFTLESAYTDMLMAFRPKAEPSEDISLKFLFHGEENEPFREKMVKFLDSITPIFPFLKEMDLTIQSANSFPHSAGIASSASSMSALALCLCDMEDQMFESLGDDETYRRKASYIARLGSGSASRSIHEGLAVWGETPTVEGSSDLYAIAYEDKVNEVFKTFHDDILIASKSEKSVSSTAGHALMEGNIYADNRYQQANNRFNELIPALQSGDLEVFGRIVEQEALTLHAMMMASNPPYILMEPNSLKLIQLVQDFRKETGHPLYFSLDAGPNLHLLYPDSIAEEVTGFIITDLLQYCENGEYLADNVGKGPLQLEIA